MAKKVLPINWTQINKMKWLGHWDHYPYCRYCKKEAVYMVALGEVGNAPFCEDHVKVVAPDPKAPLMFLNVKCEEDIKQAIARDREIRDNTDRKVRERIEAYGAGEK